MFSQTDIKSRFFANLGRFCEEGATYQVVMNHLQRAPDADVREWASWLAPKAHWGVEASMRWRPDLFSPLDLAIASAGERSKHLGEAFHYLSQYYLGLLRMGTQLYDGLQIPVFLLFGGTIVLAILQALMVGGAHSFWVHCGPPIFGLGLGGAGIFLMARLAIFEAAKRAHTDQFLRHLPILGRCWQELTESRFILALNLYLKATIPLSSALESAAKVSGSAMIQERARRVVPAMKQMSLSLLEACQKEELGSPRLLSALQPEISSSGKLDSGEPESDQQHSPKVIQGIQMANALQYEALEHLQKICNQIPKLAYFMIALLLLGKIFTLFFTFGSILINGNTY